MGVSWDSWEKINSYGGTAAAACSFQLRRDTVKYFRALGVFVGSDFIDIISVITLGG